MIFEHVLITKKVRKVLLMIKIRKYFVFFLQTFSLLGLLPFVFIFMKKENQKIDDEMYPNLCHFQKRVYRGSTKRDVLIFSADSFNNGLELAVKSLRSAGSKCRVVLLSAKPLRLPNRITKLFKTLDVEVFDNCVNRDPSRTYVPHMLRFELEKQWIEENADSIDRVFHADAFDVYFQKDPFGPDIKNDKLLFILEPHAFRSCGWNLAWMTECYGDRITQTLTKRFIICSGSIIGGKEPYLKLLDLMISQKEWSTCWQSSKDQPILNYLVWSGKVKEAGIEYELTGCNGNYLTMQWCLVNQEIPTDQYGRITSMIGSVPAFVHQYNRNKTLQTRLHRKCGDYSS